MICDVIWWCVVCVIVVLCAGGSGEGRGSRHRGDGGAEGGVESKRGDEAAAA